jgi:hypothetical protein
VNSLTPHFAIRDPRTLQVCGRQSRQQCRRLVVLFRMIGERQPT